MIPKTLQSSLGMSIILCDFSVFTLLLRTKLLFFKNSTKFLFNTHYIVWSTSRFFFSKQFEYKLHEHNFYEYRKVIK